MSLEAALQENTAVMKQLIAALTSTTIAAASGDTAPADKPATRSRKGKAAEAAAPANTSEDEARGYKIDPDNGAKIALRPFFFQVEKHNTVYEVRAGEPLIVMDDAVEIDAAKFAAERARLNQLHGIAAAAGQPSNHIGNVATVEGAKATIAASEAMQGNAPAPAAAPAPSPTTSAASAATPAGGDLDALFGTPAPAAPVLMTAQEVTGHLMALAKGTAAGQGRDAVVKLVTEAGAKDVPSLLALPPEKFSAVGAAAKALLGV
jgi:hypothetical protein